MAGGNAFCNFENFLVEFDNGNKLLSLQEEKENKSAVKFKSGNSTVIKWKNKKVFI